MPVGYCALPNGGASDTGCVSPHGATFNSNSIPGIASAAHNWKKLPQAQLFHQPTRRGIDEGAQHGGGILYGRDGLAADSMCSYSASHK